MTIGLEDQIRDYAHDVHDNEMPLTVNEITEMRLGTESVRPIGIGVHSAGLRPRRGWLVAVAAAGVALVLLGTPLWLSQLTDPDASSVAGDVVPSTVAQSTPIPDYQSGTPRATAPFYGQPEVHIPGCEIPAGWVQVCDPASFNEAVMYAVTAGGPGLVAVGANGLEYYSREDSATPGGYGGGLSDDAVVWTSPDGLTWTRVPHDVVTFGGDGGQQMFDVTAGGPGLVAVGRDGPVADGEGQAAVWTSPDGFTWSRVPHNEAIFGGEGEQRMISVTAGGPGLVAIGFDRPTEVGEGNAAVWTSPDGFTWSRVPHNEAVFGGESRQMMLSVTTGGPGLVAVGTDGYPTENNGNQLDKLDEPAVDAAVWTSPDGFTWSRVPHDEAIFGGPGAQRMASVTVGGPGLVAVGSVTGDLTDAAPGWQTFDAAVWTSPDGFTWSRVPHDDTVFASSESPPWAAEDVMLSVTAGGPGLVAVGFDSIDDCGWDSAVWTSPDGFTWSRVPDVRGCGRPGPPDRMLSVTVGPFGLVAVGEEHGSDPVSAAVWVSED